MPLDNDTCDVKMPSLKGKSWASANGDWVVYIGYNCEWEPVNGTLIIGFHFQKSQTAQRLSTPVFYVRSTTIMVTVVYGRKQFVEYPTALGITRTMKLLLSSTSLLPSLLPRLDGYCSKINFCTRMSTMMQFNTRVLCLLPPLVAPFLHGIFMLSVRLSSTIIIIVSSTCMRIS